MTAISQVGFPIAAFCAILIIYEKDKDAHVKVLEARDAEIKSIANDYRDTVKGNTEAITKLSSVVDYLCREVKSNG